MNFKHMTSSCIRHIHPVSRSIPVSYPVIACVRVARSLSKLWKFEEVARFIPKVINIIEAMIFTCELSRPAVECVSARVFLNFKVLLR